ncbi:MAG: hypothetical protein M1812_006322 [Candelaria pacifica]|nr:MAG: hypothetical protein M1812_006322 [Candelaria pacifica]
MQDLPSTNSDPSLREARPTFTTRHTVEMSYSRREPPSWDEQGWREMAARNNSIGNEPERHINGRLSRRYGSTLSTDPSGSQEPEPSRTTITAQCIPERQSLLSRARSRLIPSRNVGDGRQNHNRAGSTHNASTPQTRRLFSFLGPASEGPQSVMAERRHGLASISGPVPVLPQHWPFGNEPESGPAEALRSLERPASPTRSTLPNQNTMRRSSRLSRFRDSLSVRFQDTFTNSSSQPSDVVLPPASSTRNMSQASDIPSYSRNMLPQPGSLPRRALLIGHRGLPSLPSTPTLDLNLDMRFPPRNPPNSSPRTAYARTISNSLNRLRLPTGDVPRPPTSLGRHPTRLRRDEDQAAMLSRLLRVAAAATAQSLVGSTDRLYEARDVAHDGAGGGFEGFIHALENGGLANDLRSGGSENGSRSGSVSSDGGLAPLNFFRMFRFATPTESGSQDSASATPVDNTQGRGNSGLGDSAINGDGGGEGGIDGRMVPIIIVGIRSVTPNSGPEGDGGSMTPPILDALTTIPTPLELSREPGNNLRRREGGVSRAYSQRRTASTGPINNFPAYLNSQRNQHASNLGPQPADFAPRHNASSLLETPPGPHPPPSTPADPGLSAYSSGTTTPSHRPSSSSAAFPSSFIPALNHMRRPSAVGLDPSAEHHPSETNTARPRRLSDSDFSRHRTFGSGASRRNGVVEPDRRTHEGTRSWIIYVLGGSYPENHPILTTPSLFTDSPSYEDMLMLSSIIGTAKAPVASSQDLASALGLFRVKGTDTALMADGIGESTQFVIAPDERCSVCLVEYAIGEEVRRLNRCQHMYHRECIDEWLTTCRNSCPMCRGRGVGDDPDEPPYTTPGPSTSSSSAS